MTKKRCPQCSGTDLEETEDGEFYCDYCEEITISNSSKQLAYESTNNSSI